MNPQQSPETSPTPVSAVRFRPEPPSQIAERRDNRDKPGLEKELLHVLQHALGLDEFGRPSRGYRPSPDDDFPGCYRNHFVTGPGSKDWYRCQYLVAQGFMVNHGGREIYGKDSCCFSVTQAGFDAVKAQIPKPPKRTRGQIRWAAFRSLREVAPDLTFPEFLRCPLRERMEREEALL